MVPDAALLKVTGTLLNTSRLPLSAEPSPWLSRLKSALRFEARFTPAGFGLAEGVSTIKGSNVTADVASSMPPAGEFDPHQLLVAVTAPATLPRLPPVAPELFARRLKLTVRLLPEDASPLST